VSQVIVLLALVFSILIAIFAVQNTTAVDVQFLTLRAQAVAVSVLVLISAAIGALVMLLLGMAREVSIRWRHRSTSNQLKQAQARVAQLEAAQVTTEAPKAAETPALTSAPEVRTQNSDVS
jgi:lipopolysaccharide assembly protein A